MQPETVETYEFYEFRTFLLFISVLLLWSEWRDSNSRPRSPEPRTLPSALHPENVYIKGFQISHWNLLCIFAPVLLTFRPPSTYLPSTSLISIIHFIDFVNKQCVILPTFNGRFILFLYIIVSTFLSQIFNLLNITIFNANKFKKNF